MFLNNISLPILCWIEFEKNHGDDERTKQATMTAYRLYERLCPSAVHKCRPHVCRAISEWPEDKDWKPEVKNLGRSFQSMFAHIANEMTSTDLIRDAMTLVAHDVVLLQREQVYLNPFDLDSPVHEHHDDDEWTRCAREIKEEFDKAASLLFVKSLGEVKQLIDAEMESNEIENVQTFSGVQQAEEVTEFFQQREAFVYSYLSSIDTADSTGIIKFHLIYNAVDDDEGKLTPVTSGAFTEKVSLPFPGGYVANPWKCDSAANYFEGTWLREPVLWSRALVRLCGDALNKHLYDNNQPMEGHFKDLKSNPNRSIDCAEPAIYFDSVWKDLKASHCTLVADMERMNDIVNKREETVNEREKAGRQMTGDAQEREADMTEDAIWRTGRRGQKAELALKKKLKGIFWRTLRKKK